jgi:hypothetical protein
VTIQKISNSNTPHIIIIIVLLYSVFIFLSKGVAIVKKNPGRNGANYKLGNGPIFPSKLSTKWEGKEGFEVTLSLLNVLEPPASHTHPKLLHERSIRED